MPLELLIKIAARLRALTDAQFDALTALVETGREDAEHLPAVADALADCCGISESFNAEALPPNLRMAN